MWIDTLTLFAFSGDNWRRPTAEVEALMRLLRRFVAAETAPCVSEGIRLTVIGRRDRLAPALCASIAGAERATAEGRRMHLRLAIDDSALGASYHETAPANGVNVAGAGWSA